jgi:hypothetical protein
MKRPIRTPQPRPDAEKQPPLEFDDARDYAHYPDDIWDVFTLNEESMEPEPEPGDFWGEVEVDDWD